METLNIEHKSTSLNVNLKMRPGSTAAEIILQPGQEFTAEAGAMIAMSPTVSMTTTTYKRILVEFLKVSKEYFLEKVFS